MKQISHLLNTASRATNDNEAEMKMGCRKAQKLEVELRLANETRMKAEASSSQVEERLAVLEADRASLSERKQQL